MVENGRGIGTVFLVELEPEGCAVIFFAQIVFIYHLRDVCSQFLKAHKEKKKEFQTSLDKISSQCESWCFVW